MNMTDKKSSTMLRLALGGFLGCVILASPAYGQVTCTNSEGNACAVVPDVDDTSGSVAIGDGAEVDGYDGIPEPVEITAEATFTVAETLNGVDYTAGVTVYITYDDAGNVDTIYSDMERTMALKLTNAMGAPYSYTLTNMVSTTMPATPREGDFAVAIGDGSRVRGEKSTAIGANADVSRIETGAVAAKDGNYDVVKASDSTVVSGTGTLVADSDGDLTGTLTISDGAGGTTTYSVVKADTTYVVAAPIAAVVEVLGPATDTVAVGADSKASGDDSVVIGAGAKAVAEVAEVPEVAQENGDYTVDIVTTVGVDPNGPDGAPGGGDDVTAVTELRTTYAAKGVLNSDGEGVLTYMDDMGTPDDDTDDVSRDVHVTVATTDDAALGAAPADAVTVVTAPITRVAAVGATEVAVDNAVAIGANAEVDGDGGTAIGANAQAGGGVAHVHAVADNPSTMAVDETVAGVQGTGGTAIGDGARAAGGVVGVVAVADDPDTMADETVVGVDARAGGIAIGAGVVAGAGQIVIGDDTATLVEIGGVDLTTARTDIDTNTAGIATNVNDIATNTSMITSNAGNIANNSDDIDTNRSGIAMAVALAHLPLVNGEKGGWGIAAGSFDGESAVAIGVNFSVSDNASFKIGTASSGGETSFGIGFGMGF